MPKTIELYNLLKDKLGEEATVAVIDAFDEVTERAKNEVVTKDYFELRLTEETGKLRFEINKLRTDLDARISHQDTKIDKLRTDLDAKISHQDTKIDKLRTDLEAKIDKLRTDLEAKIDVKLSETKIEILKWTFLFWIGQLAAMVALFKFFAK
ncbi:MAG: hypothetical protein HQL03_10325 [Nitrospirae bacterium]|nr:hypothetical protein [Nitrospirota bacterium]